MEMKDEVPKIKEETSEKREKTEIQITVSIEAEATVSKLLAKKNQEMEPVRLSRKDFVSYLLEKSCAAFGDEDLIQLKRRNINEVILLEHALRQFKENGMISDELRESLWKNIDLTPSAKKSRKAGQAKSSNARLEREDAA